jgi:hypothetical protein
MKKTQLRMDEASKVGEELREAPRPSQLEDARRVAEDTLWLEEETTRAIEVERCPPRRRRRRAF